jgi:hypothetical protein
MEASTTGYGKRSGGPWYGEDSPRLIFEREASRYFPNLSSDTVTHGHDAGRRYRLIVNVPHYDARRIQILFRKDSPEIPRVTVDGPADSKHRFPSGDLCMWYCRDPVGDQWIFENGLVALVGHIAAHLFREAWYRETGEWPGPEVDHSEIESESAKQQGAKL